MVQINVYKDYDKKKKKDKSLIGKKSYKIILHLYDHRNTILCLFVSYEKDVAFRSFFSFTPRND